MSITAGSSSDINISMVWSASLLHIAPSPTYLISFGKNSQVVFFLDSIPVQGIECVDIPAVLVKAAHAIGRTIREESVQDGNLRWGKVKKYKIHFRFYFPSPPVQNVDEAASADQAVGSSFLSRKFPVCDTDVYKEYDN